MSAPQNGNHRQLINTLEDRIRLDHAEAVTFKEFPYDDLKHKTNGEIDLLAKIGNTYLIFEMKCHGHKDRAKEQLHRAKAYLKEYYKPDHIYMFYVCYDERDTYNIQRIK